jgi:hypothetical protein
MLAQSLMGKAHRVAFGYLIDTVRGSKSCRFVLSVDV